MFFWIRGQAGVNHSSASSMQLAVYSVCMHPVKVEAKLSLMLMCRTWWISPLFNGLNLDKKDIYGIPVTFEDIHVSTFIISVSEVCTLLNVCICLTVFAILSVFDLGISVICRSYYKQTRLKDIKMNVLCVWLCMCVCVSVYFYAFCTFIISLCPTN